MYKISPKTEKSALQENSAAQEKFYSKSEQQAVSLKFVLENKTPEDSTRDSGTEGLAVTITREDPDSAEGSKLF